MRVLLNAGESKSSLHGTTTGVFIGVWAAEFAEVLASNEAMASSVYSVTGATCSVIVGRLSFALGMQGPCISVDTACSSGLSACYSASRSLQRSECPLALAVAQHDLRPDNVSRHGHCGHDVGDRPLPHL